MENLPDAITTQELAELIRHLRSDNGSSGRDAAAKLGVETQLLAAWEKGERLTKVAAFLALLTEVYGCTVKVIPPRQPPLVAGVEGRSRYAHRVISRSIR